MTYYLAFDTETHPIEGCKVAPPPVCLTLASWMEDADLGGGILDCITTSIYTKDQIPEILTPYLEDPECVLVTQFGAFDCAVCCGMFPEMFPAFFKAYDENRIVCVSIREQLMNLSVFGQIDKEVLPDGGKRHIGYSLGDFVLSYFGLDISDDKKSEDSWRKNFNLLDGVPLDQWPAQAKQYAMDDAKYTLGVHLMQEERAKETGATLVPHEFRAKVNFALYLATCEGMEIDQEEKQRIQDWIADTVAPEKLALLVEAGILQPAEPPRPHKKNKDKMVAGKPEKINTAPLQERVVAVANACNIPVPMTPTGRVSCADDTIEELAPYDEVLQQYQTRQKVQKLVTTELPRMSAPIIHPGFEVLKVTGRTSSRASDLYPSFNGQNVDPRVRPCFAAPEGWLYLSSDYSSIELVTLAQKLLDLFKKSKLADIINKGWNAHSFLAAQMALEFDDNFRNACEEGGCKSRDDAYLLFMQFKKSPDKDVVHFYNHWRTFAKPTGLGYPGGLGAKTFIQYAKGTYGITVTLEQAEAFKNVWFEAYPEMHDYFQWVTEQHDPFNPGKLGYVSPLGMYRAGCVFTECANGAALQTPAAEGGTWAFYNVSKACYNHAQASPLFGCKPKLFIHDEILMQIPDDEFSHERSLMVQDIMVECMREITPDVRVSTEAKLMRRWYKEAQPVFDQQGRLIPWEPTPAT